MKIPAKAHNRPCSVLFISALDFWSMGERKGGPALWQTVKDYADRGWEVYFITGNRAQGNTPDLPNNVHVIRFDIPWLKKLVSIKKIGFFAKAIWWLYFQCMAFFKAQRLHTPQKINVVYGYEICGVPVAKVLSKLWHVPMVSRFQGSILRLVWMRRPFWRLRAWEYVVAYKLAALSNLVIMTNDGSQGNRLLAQMGVEESKTKFWLNGLDKERFAILLQEGQAKQELKIQHHHVLLCVSRLMALKQVDRSIQALPEVLKDFPDTVLIIVGDGPERGQLEQLTRELGVAQHVRFEGAVPHDEVPKYLAAADIFLSFYDWSNVGNPLLEAMMAGRCIVTLNNGDTAEFVHNGENGILLECSELWRLADVVVNLLSDQEEVKRLGDNAKKFAREHFWSWEERMDAEVQAVEALLS